MYITREEAGVTNYSFVAFHLIFFYHIFIDASRFCSSDANYLTYFLTGPSQLQHMVAFVRILNP